jgi:protein-S-isoprenylcysteine O-methyltransferase Ste14
MAAGEYLRFMTLSHAGPYMRTRIIAADRLIMTGPYAHVRNPLYLGNFFIMCGALVMSWTWFPWLMLIAIAMFAVQYHLIMRFEEHFLEEKFGDQYREYRSSVPRFIPRITEYGDQECTPDYRKALRSEKNSLRAEIILILLIALRWGVYLWA